MKPVISADKSVFDGCWVCVLLSLFEKGGKFLVFSSSGGGLFGFGCVFLE